MGKVILKYPSLRFKEFSDEWRVVKIEKICEAIIDCVNKTATVVDYETPYKMIRTSNVRKGKVDLTSVRYATKDIYEKWTRRGAPKPGDLIFTREAPVGEIGILTDNKGIFLGQRTIMYRINSFFSNNAFVLYSFQTHFCKKQIEDFSNGGTVAHMRVPDCGKIKISNPTLPEQKKIASFLSAVDKKIEQLTRKKQLLEQYKKGVMQKLFSQEIRFKDENGNDYPDWFKVSFLSLGEIIGGGTPDSTVKKFWNGNINWFTPTEIKSKHAISSKRKISKLGLQNSSATLLPSGTILFTSRATIADISFATQECTTNQGFQSLIVNNKNDSHFIYHMILFNKKEFLRKSQGSTFLEISKTEIKKIKLFIPSKLEQEKIGIFLDHIDDKIESVRNQKQQTQSFKKGLLQQMFV
ncbi:MAG: restriction endonuclease subunit S [Fibrobacteria bacterium]|nr:restriction endonuclease subunit S [Fibrobacteria bacterium]